MNTAALSLAGLLLAAAPASADLLSGRVLDAAGLPLPACNLDVIDVVTGNDMALAGDTTDASGLFSIDVPTGLYLVHVTPPPGSLHLVGEVDGVAVIGPTAMGDIQLVSGALLSGMILLPGGLPAVGANLDIELANGDEYFPAGDTTDDTGLFSMVVPLGELALQVRPETLTATLLAPV
ncbi:MAG: carboxypeptidase-like regulatory domain-containing protein, partial [Planctomycetota bacterium]|nr:carboxypeptidase-like regulatory domain-containing protein [Planctomycetota bacterium]